jgi:RNAse (barnase) inhibitor barstar
MASLFSDQSGVYKLPASVSATEVEREAQERGFRFIDLNGQDVTNRHELFQLAKTVFELPAHFGNNWDALLDMLRDLSWLPATGYVVFAHNFESLAKQDPVSYEHLSGVLTNATEFYAERMRNQPPMIVLIA